VRLPGHAKSLLAHAARIAAESPQTSGTKVEDLEQWNAGSVSHPGFLRSKKCAMHEKIHSGKFGKIDMIIEGQALNIVSIIRDNSFHS
jgi:hypothetical protein